MFYKRREGEKIKNGINYYGLDDPGSRGFILKIWRWYFRCRYSLQLEEWIIYSTWADKDGCYRGRKVK